MSAPIPIPRVRRSFRDIEADHYKARKAGDKGPTELETLIKAWAAIQKLSPTDLDSFFMIGGYHGEPFRGAGWGNGQWWGGYCYHGQILFPTWHRAYLMRLEDALRSVPGCENVALPFWDECAEESLASGVPDTFGQRNFELGDGTSIPNPLFSYEFNGAVYDNIATFTEQDPTDYTKPVGYKTVRYPLSGLVGKGDKEKTEEHNKLYPDDAKNFELLNTNVKNWLVNKDIVNDEDQPKPAGVRNQFAACLNVPFYTVFSNVTSATAYSQDFFDPSEAAPATGSSTHNAVPLEQPHNAIHLAVGGFETPKGGNFDAIHDANGDMGENDTAAFDPIFYFHHCYIDRMFWLWQNKWDQTNGLVLEDRFKRYPGTNTVDSQGPTPGMPANSWLTLDTQLEPFTKIVKDGRIVAISTVGNGDPVTSQDLANIHALGYTYGPGSFDEVVNPPPANPAADKPLMGVMPLARGPVEHKPGPPVATLRVAGINRGRISGSFVVSTWAKEEGDSEPQLIGVEPILSRRRTDGCANCQTHLGVKTFVPLKGVKNPHEAEYTVRVHTRDDPTGKKHIRKIRKELGVLSKD